MNGPMRRIDLCGVPNFRDLGGYAAVDGRRVRWRRLFRSSHLGSLSAADQMLLAGLGVRSICDFRGEAESQARPSRLEGVTVRALPIEPSIAPRLRGLMAGGGTVTGAVAADLMRDTYRAYVRSHAERFRDLFQHLLASDAPTVFHCSAGKDRTGFAAALILTSLGVAREVIVEDYLLTNRYWRHNGADASGLPEEVSAVLAGVQADYLASAFAAIDEDFGGVDEFLSRGLGIGPAERLRLAAAYLE